MVDVNSVPLSQHMWHQAIVPRGNLSTPAKEVVGVGVAGGGWCGGALALSLHPSASLLSGQWLTAASQKLCSTPLKLNKPPLLFSLSPVAPLSNLSGFKSGSSSCFQLVLCASVRIRKKWSQWCHMGRANK